ncbi:Myblike DNAbinding domain-containing protein [Podila epigama]|nr:Myblike DNAbinding domain-containing protein [Podila epigama]
MVERPKAACSSRYYRVLDPYLADAVEDDLRGDAAEQDPSSLSGMGLEQEHEQEDGQEQQQKNNDDGQKRFWTAKDREMLEAMVMANESWAEISRKLKRNQLSCKEKWSRILHARLQPQKERAAQRKRLGKEGFTRVYQRHLLRAVEQQLAKARNLSLPTATLGGAEVSDSTGGGVGEGGSLFGYLDMVPVTGFPVALTQGRTALEAIDWDAIAASFNHHDKYTSFPAERLRSIYYELASTKLVWTPEEDDRLIQAVIRLGPPELRPNLWNVIKEAFEDGYRTGDEYRQRWRELDMPLLEREWDDQEKKKFWRRFLEYQKESGSLLHMEAFRNSKGEPRSEDNAVKAAKVKEEKEEEEGNDDDDEEARGGMVGLQDQVSQDKMWDQIAEGLEFRHGRDCEAYFKRVTARFPKDPVQFWQLIQESANEHLRPQRVAWTAETTRQLVEEVNSYFEAHQTVCWNEVVRALGNKYSALQCIARWDYWSQVERGDGGSAEVRDSERMERKTGTVVPSTAGIGSASESESESKSRIEPGIESGRATEPLTTKEDEIDALSSTALKSQPRRWTDKELETLMEGVEKYGHQWAKIRDELLPHRTTQMLKERFQRSKQQKKLGQFSARERSLLEAAMETLGENASWEEIANLVPGRSAIQCRQHWMYGQTHHVERADEPWTDKDRERLKLAVERFGTNRWKLVSEFVVGKTAHRCRMEWREKMNPKVNLEPWTDNEMGQLMSLVVVQMEADESAEEERKRRWKSDLLKGESSTGASREQTTLTTAQFMDLEPRFKGKRKVDWHAIAQKLPGRTARQCRVRFGLHRRLYLIDGNF